MGIKFLLERTCDSCGSIKLTEPNETWGYRGDVQLPGDITRDKKAWFACSRDCIGEAVAKVYHSNVA